MMNIEFELGSALLKIWHSWVAGGWTMVPIALVALALYTSGFQLLWILNRRGARLAARPDAELRRWVESPAAAPSEVAEILRYTQDDVSTLEDSASRFAEVEASRVGGLDRRLTTLNVLVGAAPLLGLLGTVLGMLVTFRAIATGGGKMVDQMAVGISEALITTEMGLLVALPGMVLAYLIRRKRNEYVSLIARLESITLRHLRVRLHGMTRAFVKSGGKVVSVSAASVPAAASNDRTDVGGLAGVEAIPSVP